jgi:hypothetical protein
VEDLDERLGEIPRPLDENVGIIIQQLRSGETFIDYSLRKNLEIGYAPDTNVLLKIVGFSPYKKREKLLNWFQKNLQTIYYRVQLYETVSVIEKRKEEEWKKSPTNSQWKKIQMIEENLINLLRQPNVRLVIYKPKNFKSLNPELYGKLSKECGRDFWDMELILLSEYERIKLFSFDDRMNQILFKFDLRFVDPYKSLPSEYMGKWKDWLK